MSEVEQLIPHRAPFLFVDEILERSAGSIVTSWTPAASSEFFRGHYPDYPLLPGVLLCEASIQAGALLVAGEEDAPPTPGMVPVLTKIGAARFRRPVRPGEELQFAVELTHSVGPARYMLARVTSGRHKVARLEFVVTLAPLREEDD